MSSINLLAQLFTVHYLDDKKNNNLQVDTKCQSSLMHAKTKLIENIFAIIHLSIQIVYYVEISPLKKKTVHAEIVIFQMQLNSTEPTNVWRVAREMKQSIKYRYNKNR